MGGGAWRRDTAEQLGVRARIQSRTWLEMVTAESVDKRLSEWELHTFPCSQFLLV